MKVESLRGLKFEEIRMVNHTGAEIRRLRAAAKVPRKFTDAAWAQWRLERRQRNLWAAVDAERARRLAEINAEDI